MTGGDFGLYRWNMGATPSGPAPHFHRTTSESFFVIDGTRLGDVALGNRRMTPEEYDAFCVEHDNHFV